MDLQNCNFSNCLLKFISIHQAAVCCWFLNELICVFKVRNLFKGATQTFLWLSRSHLAWTRLETGDWDQNLITEVRGQAAQETHYPVNLHRTRPLLDSSGTAGRRGQWPNSFNTQLSTSRKTSAFTGWTQANHTQRHLQGLLRIFYLFAFLLIILLDMFHMLWYEMWHKEAV